MTAEPDLLPLPEPEVHDAAGYRRAFSPVQLRDYARANVAHATAARDAEVEALRERAERLAEALQEAREYVVSELAAERDKFAGYEHCSNIASIEADLAKIDAALEQETTNG